MNGLLGQRPAVNGLLDIPVTANRNMLAQAVKARNKPEFQMKENTLQGILDGAAMATSPVPILGDLLGLGADGYRFATDPSSRNMLNYGLAALGALPMIPAMSMGLGKLAQSQGKTLGALPAGPGRNQAGAIVYHGSPHKFDAFDSSKIGTGEGAQAYGHGLYFAENPKVALEYQKNLSADGFRRGDGGVFDPSTLGHLNVRAAARTGDLDGAIDKARQIANSDSPVASTAAKDLQALMEIKASGGISPNTGALYKVDLPDEAIAKMLDWDKPLSQQAPEVRKAVNEFIKSPAGLEAAKEYHGYKPGMTLLDLPGWNVVSKGGPHGDTIYRAMFGSGDVAANKLNAQGIPGIRYLDEGSRGAGKGTSNYVVFPGNEGLLRILDRQ